MKAAQQSKKVVIIIAEGNSEEYALYPFLKELGKPLNIMFTITHGDILSDYKNEKTSHKDVISSVVNDFIKERKFLKEDILIVAQLTDTDGVFMDESKVIVDNSVERIKYSEEFIAIHNESQIDAIVNRNKLKSDKLKALVKTDFTLSNIPYKIYYFSCNLDHVLHGDPNSDGKAEKADEFANSMNNSDIHDFFELQAIYDTENYEGSWEFVFNDNNSLKRGSNLILLLNELNTLVPQVE
ncbi:hypothetical protein ACFSFY_05870 [Sporosarcina siberiensis]|uniref:Uncharacterized protein n=1 Tax=Sporosarcina siberiensis TaxID=1365606 RepID=A0ABW4SDM3_9BACL